MSAQPHIRTLSREELLDRNRRNFERLSKVPQLTMFSRSPEITLIHQRLKVLEQYSSLAQDLLGDGTLNLKQYQEAKAIVMEVNDAVVGAAKRLQNSLGDLRGRRNRNRGPLARKPQPAANGANGAKPVAPVAAAPVAQTPPAPAAAPAVVETAPTVAPVVAASQPAAAEKTPRAGRSRALAT